MPPIPPLTASERMVLIVAIANEVWSVNAAGEFVGHRGYPFRCVPAFEPDLSERAAELKLRRLRESGGGAVGA